MAEYVYSSDAPLMNALYQRCLADRWTSDRVQFVRDAEELAGLDPVDRDYFKFLFAFLSTVDDIVGLDCMDLARNFPEKDVAHYYVEQASIEMVHSRVYARILNLFFPGPEHRDRYVNEAIGHPAFRAKVDWIKGRVVDPAVSLAEKYILFVLAEGIFFVGSFASIACVRNLDVCRGIAMANEYIARDESTHVEASCTLYLHHVGQRLPEGRVHQLFREAVLIELDFVSCLPSRVVPLEDVKTFVLFTADRLLIALGYRPLYGAPEPGTDFPLRYAMSCPRNTNTIETQGTDYAEDVINDI